MHRIVGKRRRWYLIALLAGLFGVLLSGSALAAEFGSSEIYRLNADEVVEDDFYVTGNEVYIDGTIQGDLVAAASYVEVNGTVTGDAILAGAGVVINGTVEDDVRAAGSGVIINGSVGDDLFAAAGGGDQAFSTQMFGTNQTIQPGFSLTSEARVGGDAVIAAGGSTVAGAIEEDLYVGAGNLVLSGQVSGNADLDGDTIIVQDSASVGGALSYTTEEPITVPPNTAANVNYSPPEERYEEEGNAFPGWLLRTVLILAGFALVGWLLLRFAPALLGRPATALSTHPLAAALFGFSAAVLFIFIPVLSALLVFLMVLFGGWFPGIVLGIFLFGTLALIWFLSPLVTGLWIGQRLNAMFGREVDNLPILIGGILLLALLGRIPILGWFVYLLSFIFALGGLILARRSSKLPTAIEQGS